GEVLSRPRRVRFVAEMVYHLLQWEPGHDAPGDVRYEVEHTVYGTNFSWTAIPNCKKIWGHTCDLTYYTLDPTLRYYARVRAVSGNRTSDWQRTNSFSPQEASLRLSGQSLSVMGNSIHVQLQLLLKAGNLTIKYEDIQKHARRYRVYVRRAQDNQTYKVLETASEFHIHNLFWDTEYCISVEPDVASRHIRAVRTAEQCITICKKDRSAELILNIVSSFFITLFLLGLLGALLVCTYIKKPVRPPSVLKTFMKQSSLWVEQETSSSGSMDADPIQQLFLCQKEPQQHGGPSSKGTVQPPPEKGSPLPAWPKDWVQLLGLVGSRDSSCTSTDSGICLHSSSSSSSSSSSKLSLAGCQGYKRQPPAGDDSGVGLESSLPLPASSLVEAGHGGEPSLCPAAGQESQQEVEFRGYLQQSKGTVEQKQDQADGVHLSGCAGSLWGPDGTDIVLDIDCSELAVAKGYLKQSSPEHPCSHSPDLAALGSPREAPAWDCCSQLGPQAPTLLSYGAPVVPLASKASPELLKVPFDLGIFNTDLLGTLPLISSLSTNEWLTLQINPLSVLDGDSKDSRL
ncbi:I10R1 protein, partial [Chauna torquata]|nr:I10R1 protein [Chauna torquata]